MGRRLSTRLGLKLLCGSLATWCWKRLLPPLLPQVQVRHAIFVPYIIARGDGTWGASYWTQNMVLGRVVASKWSFAPYLDQPPNHTPREKETYDKCISCFRPNYQIQHLDLRFIVAFDRPIQLVDVESSKTPNFDAVFSRAYGDGIVRFQDDFVIVYLSCIL